MVSLDDLISCDDVKGISIKDIITVYVALIKLGEKNNGEYTKPTNHRRPRQ